MTRYHLVSRQRTSHTAPFPASRKFRQWLGISSSPQRPSAFAGPQSFGKRTDDSSRNNGRTRECLLIDTPAPRPCSAASAVPTLTKQGSLNVSASILFSSSLFLVALPIIPQKGRFCQHFFSIADGFPCVPTAPQEPADQTPPRSPAFALLFFPLFSRVSLLCHYCLPHTQKICTRRRCLRVHAYSIANTSRSSHLTSHGLPRSISESSAR